MTKIKIAHILHCVGGVDISLRLTLENIDQTKFENIIVHGEDDCKDDFFDKIKITHHKVSIIREISLIKDLKSIIQTYKILKEEKPQIIHAHSAKGGVIGRIVGFLLNINVLYTPHAFSFLSTNINLKKRVYIFIENSLIFKNNYVLACSPSEMKRAIHEVGYKKEKVVLFNNSINPIKAVSNLTIQKTWPDEYICTVGRPCYQKNIELMLKIIFEVKKKRAIHLVIMGVGHHSSNLKNVKNLIGDLELHNSVTLLDWTDRDNIINIISKSKLYISTARYEGLPYSVIEALALSKPCLVTNCDGNRDLINHGYNGFIFEDDNVIEFAEKIDMLLDDNLLLNKLSENALASFNQNYNIEHNISNLENIYRKFSSK